MTDVDKIKERQRLANLINQWNQDHYDIFELSQPNEECEFHGVVRFYFQDGANVVTKCIRVASSATAEEVVSVLVEKFRPDMRMLSANKYALYEVHVNGEERRLVNLEKVLYVQLNWGNEVREGRFLLKREGVPTISPHTEKENQPTFKRKMSKREKKEKKKQDKEQKKSEAVNAAEQLYTDMPETRFTRSISNPEAVMKRRRQQKVEKKLQQCRGQDGQGGTLKIYGETINRDVPYKTLLLSTADHVRYVIRETMEKYGLEKEDPSDFCLVQVLVPTGEREYHGDIMGEERFMEDHECPLAIAMDFPPSKGTMMFHFKRRPNDAKKPKHKKMRAVSHEDLRSNREDPAQLNKVPFLVELNPDGSDNPKGKVHRLTMKSTEVGSDPTMSIRVMGSNIQPRHCLIGLTQNDSVVTITPYSPEAKTYVNNQRVFEITTLQNGMTVRFGKLSVFRFIDPNYEEKLRKGLIPPDGALRSGPPHSGKPLETDLDGDVRNEPMMTSHSPRDRHETELKKRNIPNQMESPHDERGPPALRSVEDVLPATIEYREDKEEPYFMNVILDSSNSGVHFKLAPTYVIYMSVRFCLSNAYRPELGPQERAIRITSMNNKIAELIHKAIHANRDNPAALAFWMANSSEILHFFKQDLDINPFSQDSQEMLAESVQMAFHHLVRCLQYDLERTMPAFLDENDDQDMNGDRNRGQYRGRSSLEDVLDTLSSAMNLLRRCRVNAALTIQLFSQLFHFINMWLFNILVGDPNHQFCTRLWGVRLKRRLGSIEAWAEKQGLELAADCHLCRIIQAAHLLQAQKSSPDDIPDISSTCFKLNSLQLHELLVRYIPEPNEPPIPHSVIDGVVKIAENMADQQIKTEGRDILLEEDSDLQLPFLLPEDGYSCDTVKGIPKGLDEFVDPLSRAGLCRMTPQPGSNGDWTVYMAGDEGPRIDEAVRKGQQQQQQQQQQASPSPGQHPRDAAPRPQPQLPKDPEVITVAFSKVKGSMGLSIVAATPEGNEQKQKGIYIKSVVPGGAAALDGRLQAGDQLLEVDGKSLVGLSQEKGAELMTKTGLTVRLKVAKQGAFYHGLATLLSQPSPVMQRASPKKPSSPQVNKQRPQEEGPPPYNGTPDMERNRQFPGQRDQHPFDKQRQNIQSPHSRSSPSLNSDNMGPGARATSTGNLRDPPPQHSPHGNRLPPQRDLREPDPKSKSIPNLRMDNSFDHRDMHQPYPNQQMRPAASVGTLQHGGGQFPDYYNQGRNDPRGNDYENHPTIDPRLQKPAQEAMRPDRGYPDVNHNMPPGQIVKPNVHSVDQGPPSSRNSSSSFRDDRPQSAYYGQQDRPEFRDERPKSMEINANKMQEMQRFGQPQYSPHQSPHERSFDSDRDPNYANTRGQPPHMQSGYVNQSDIPKFTANNEARQPNFYENTSPRQNEPSPAFHQLRGPPPEDTKFRPQTMPKPTVAPKPNTQKVVPVEIPRVDVDNRQTQQHFFDPRMPQHDMRQQGVPLVQQNYIHGQPQMANSPTSTQGRGKFSPGREMYNPHQSPELPPPPQELPPELPPPPALEDLPEELPPLPPPPVNDYRVDPHMQSSDPHYANATPSEPRFMSQPGFQQNRMNQPQQRVHPQQHFPSNQPRDNQRQMAFAEPQQQHGPLSATFPQRFQPNHDYQNISYEKQNRSFDPPSQHSPNQNNHVYETYDPKSQTLPANSKFDMQQNRTRLISEMSDLTTRAKKDGNSLISPWDREEQDKQQKMREEEMSRLRDQEIAELESRQFLSPQDQERLRRFRLEQEFQRRVQEVSGRDDDDEDSDPDITSRTQGREFLMQTIQEDIHKAQRKMEDLNKRQQYEDFEREKDRMERLERKLEIFEREREERRQQMQKRQEKKQREHEEHQRKQRELREKQRKDYEEQKRMHMMEEEKLRKRQEEETRKRKEMEKERLREIQAQRDKEEAALRAEARRREEEYQRQQMEQRQREKREQEREIRVEEERKRLEAMALQNQSQGYQQYANLPAQSQFGAPPPPQRGSSYDVANNPQMSRSNPNIRGNDMQNGFRNMNNNNASSSLRNLQDSSNFAPKKSVSFNTQLETQINRYSVSSENEQTPHASQSSYRSSHSSISSEQNALHSPNSHMSQGQQMNPDFSMNDTVFENNTTPQQPNNVAYLSTENTPNVVGAQEIYRDPRSRIMAQKEAQGGIGKKAGNDRMSFRDKMKFFAQEAGENTPKDKPRASKTLRHIESQLHNGQ